MRAIVSGPPRVLSITAIVWLCALFVIYSDTGVSLPGFFLLIFGGAGLVVAWVLRGAAFWALHKEERKGRADSRSLRIGWWMVPPLCLATAAALAVFLEPPNNLLFRMRFAASERALSEQAQSMLATASSASFDRRRVGLFFVDRAQAFEGQVRFITTGCGVVDSCGLVYSPGGQPRRWQEDEFSHLGGPWWHVYEGF